jgi:hypothetical protein
MLWLILLMLFMVLILIYWEYQIHDTNDNNIYKKKYKKYDSDDSDDPIQQLEDIQWDIKNNYDFSNWRLSMIVGVVAALPIIYYIEARMPTLFEWVIVGGLIFIASYLSSNWIWSHFHYPNGTKIEKSIIKAKDQINKIITNYKIRSKPESQNYKYSSRSNSSDTDHNTYNDQDISESISELNITDLNIDNNYNLNSV